MPQSIFWQKIQIIVGFFYLANHAVDVWPNGGWSVCLWECLIKDCKIWTSSKDKDAFSLPMATIFPIDLNWNWLCTGIRSSLYVLLSRCCHMVIMIYVGNLGQKGGNWVKYWCPSLPLSSWFSGANWINLRACILNVLSLLSFKPIFFFQDWQVFSQAVSHVLHTIQSHLLDYPRIFLSCFELPLSLEGLKLYVELQNAITTSPTQ